MVNVIIKKYLNSLVKKEFRYFMYVMLISKCCIASNVDKCTLYKGDDSSDFLLFNLGIDGDQYNFILDTKSYISSVSDKLINKFGREAGKSIKIILSSQEQYDKKLYYIPKISLGIADINYEDPVIALNYFSFKDTYGFNIDGVIGLDFLGNLLWRKDNKNNKVMVYTKDANIDYRGYSCHNYFIDDKGMKISIMLNGSKIPFYLDSGSSSSFIQKNLSRNRNIISESTFQEISRHKDFIGNDYYSRNVGYVKNISFFDKDLSYKIHFHEGNENILGVDFIKLFDNFIIDTKNNSICTK